MSRIEKLIGDMTLAEKLGQLTMTACSYTVTGPVLAGDSSASVADGTVGNLLNLSGAEPTRHMQRLAVEGSRLRIPLLIGLDILHGHRTLFPIPLAEAALFDPAAWTETARAAATEGAHDGLSLTFAPMLDVCRDPRWGRTAEGPGEDPWLGARIAEAKVRGLQGQDLASPESLAACAKHFCAYGAVTAGREYAAVDVSERALHEVHIPPFEAAIAAGVATIMPAFTDLAGIPMTANAGLLQDTLRERLGFDGVLVSDYNAIAELIRHGVASDLVEAAALALRAGVDIDMMSDAYRLGLPVALQRGLVSLAQIDTAVRRVLRLKEQLGLFEDPYRRGSKAETSAAIARRRQLARSVAARAIVMLKNERETLPLAASVARLALIGPLADAAREMGGPWTAAAEPEQHVSVLSGLQSALPGVSLVHDTGVTIEGEDRSRIARAVSLCKDAEAIILCLGEAAGMSGEAKSRAHPGLPGQQRALAEAVIASARAAGQPVIVVLFCGRPLVIPWLAEQADALLVAWFLGSEAGNALADVIVGRHSPSGRTPISWPRALGQVPVFFGQRPGGRPADSGDPYTSRYLDVANEPLYPFGYGLGYARFSHRNLRVTPEAVCESGTIEAHVDVTNEGPRTAEETVFLFIRDRVASVSRPLLELKGFAKAILRPGETTTVRLAVPAADLRFPGPGLRPVFEPGEVEVLAGPCADRSKLLGATVLLRA